MATVFGRCLDLEIKLDKSQRSKVGEAVSAFFKGSTDATREKVKSLEKCKVWNYSDNVTPVIDACIMAIANPPPSPEIIEKPKRKRISSLKIKTT